MRRFLLLFGGVVALLGGVTSLQAQITCIVSAAPTYVRYQGLTEQVGDVLLQCTGGTPTQGGKQVPTANFAINVGSTNITSRLVGPKLPDANGAYPLTEALLAINDPKPAAPSPASAPVNQTSPEINVCPASNTGTCSNLGTNYGGAPGLNSSYRFGSNVFQGYLFDSHTIRFDGIPFDAPGPNASLSIRLTNIRIDATAFSSASMVGNPVDALMSVTSGNSGQAITIQNNGPTTIAYPQNGLVFNAGAPVSSSVCMPGGSFDVSIQEGFASSFKQQNIAVPTSDSSLTAPVDQNIFGYQYFTESGYYNSFGGSTAYPNYAGVGQATQGTRLQVYIDNVPAGVTVTAPELVYLDGGSINPPGNPSLATLLNGHSGIAHLVGSVDVNGAGTYSPGTGTTAASTTGQAKGFVYEILYSDPSSIETMPVSFDVSYAAGSVQYTIPPTFTTAVTAFAPFSPGRNNIASLVTPLDGDHSIPRFQRKTSGGARSVYSLTGCQCDLLFPYVVSQGGIETGIAIANTSADPYGTRPQNGYVQLFYYPDASSQYDGGNQTPFSHTTATQINAGDQLLMVLGSGSANEGANIDGAPGFQGYIIAVAGFQYCHGYAFITDAQVQEWAQGYLALQLDSYLPTFPPGPHVNIPVTPQLRGGPGGVVSAPDNGEILQN